MHCKTPEYCWDSIITFGTVDTSIMVAIYLSTSHTLSLLHCTNNNAFVVWWRAASPLHRNTPIQHTRSCLIFNPCYFVAFESRRCHGFPIGYVTYPRCCYYLSLEAESYALMTVWKNIPPPLWQKVYTARGPSKPHFNCRLPLPPIDVVIVPSHQVGCADIMT